jgi:hypothetical protein
MRRAGDADDAFTIYLKIFGIFLRDISPENHNRRNGRNPKMAMTDPRRATDNVVTQKSWEIGEYMTIPANHQLVV